MEKHVPLSKMSKAKQREHHARKRGSWGTLNPVTRRPQNPKAYNRKRARSWREEDAPGSGLVSMLGRVCLGGRGPKRLFWQSGLSISYISPLQYCQKSSTI